MFLSLEFWIASIVFLLIYGLLKTRTKVGMMLWTVAFSLLFLYRADGILALTLPFVTLVSWSCTKWMERLDGTPRKAVLALAIVVTLIPLAYFKYANFAISTFNDLLRTNFALRDILLPAGLSFFCLQAVSYQMDVYRGTFTGRAGLLEYAFYQTFFPLLLCGPITRSTVFFPQISRLKEPVKEEALWGGLFLFISGMLKKGAFADYISQYTTMLFDNPASYSGFENLCGVVGYSFQIYLDFSGYSDMTIGIAAMLGITLPDNFNYPYRSANVAEFWHRWHISLSTWFRDYLYIPLGGNRRGRGRTYLNLMVVMLVSGLWHGASWMFVIWGGLHGLGLVVSRIMAPHIARLPQKKALRWARTALCFVFVTLCWIFFRSPDMECCRTVFTKIFTDTDIAYMLPFVQVRGLWCAIVLLCAVASLLPEVCAGKLRTLFIKSPWVVRLLVFCLALQLMLWLNMGYVAPMIYAQF